MLTLFAADQTPERESGPLGTQKEDLTLADRHFPSFFFLGLVTLLRYAGSASSLRPAPGLRKTELRGKP